MALRRVLGTALRAGVPFGLFFGAYLAFRSGAERGLSGGLLAGVLFGGIIAVFSETQRKKMMAPGDQFEGEPILHQGPANHFRNAEARGGWLILTSARLVFRSHGKNIQNQSVELPLAGVRGVEPVATMLLVPNGLRVLGDDGASDRFVVSERKVWVARIEAACQKLRS
jgi:hypothetical protein